MFSRRARLRLQDIVEDGERLEHFVGKLTLAQFNADEKTLLAAERLLQRITEAVIQIGPEDMTKVGAEIPVAAIRAFGNKLRHDYRNLDPAQVLSIAQNNVPALREAAARALES